MDLHKSPHKRFNPLTGEWILVSPHRLNRPWQGKVEEIARPVSLHHDPACYLCPGNERAGGHHNPPYSETFVFTNDFAALLPDAPSASIDEQGLFVSRTERGICRVICFSPRHDLTLAQMHPDDIARVVEVWKQQYLELGALDFISHVQIFENKGALMGCSNPHPHGQVWATETIPQEPDREDHHQLAYFNKHGRTLLQDYIAAELKDGARIVAKNDTWVAVVPYWAKWPFEVLTAPIEPVASMDKLTDSQSRGLAEILNAITTRYDNLFNISFPYTMGFHQAPTDGRNAAHWHMHAHFYPPLLRSATVQKFMVGFEMLATPQRDITAESAAERLRGLSPVHYLQTVPTAPV